MPHTSSLPGCFDCSLCPWPLLSTSRDVLGHCPASGFFGTPPFLYSWRPFAPTSERGHTIKRCVYLCMRVCRIFMYLCMWPLLCISFFHVYRILNFMFSGPSFFIKIPFVKVVDFNAGEAMRGHGHFWWIYPLGARFRYSASLLDFPHAFGLIHKNISFC